MPDFIPEGRGNGGRWKARKTKLRFPSLSTALGNRQRFPHSHRLYYVSSTLTKHTESQKGALTWSWLPPGSSFDWNMLPAYFPAATF
jgi:hypothetical protein